MIRKIDWYGLEAVEFSKGDYTAMLIPSVGGNLVRLANTKLGVEILRTPTEEEIETFKSRPQIFGLPLLFPPNRIENGRYEFEGRTYQYPITIEELQTISGVGAGKAQKFGAEFVKLIKAYVDEKEILRPQDMVVKGVANKASNKIFIIQSIDRKMDFEDIARAKNLDMDELLTEIEAIVNSGTRLDIQYYLNTVMDEDKVEDIYLYFKEDAETDSLDAAIDELGSEYSEEEIRLVRIKFISEVAN